MPPAHGIPDFYKTFNKKRYLNLTGISENTLIGFDAISDLYEGNLVTL